MTNMNKEKIKKLYPCGLYKTLETIQIGDGRVEPYLLVYFHNHSEPGYPLISYPEKNEFNRWKFQKNGVLLKEENHLTKLQILKPEGLYFVKEHFHPNKNEVVADHALVQLGYTREAEPILFFPRLIEDTNALNFPTTGMKIPAEIYHLLEKLDLRGPHVPNIKHVH